MSGAARRAPRPRANFAAAPFRAQIPRAAPAPHTVAMPSSTAMTKADIVRELAEKTGSTQSDVEKTLDALKELAARELKKPAGKFSLLPGLITVERYRKNATKPRDGRNPRTGESLRIPGKPAHDAVRVKAGKALKDMV